jgi:uncharacterized protein
VHVLNNIIPLGFNLKNGASFQGHLSVILRSNMLVQANSGGGKSYALRRMIEQNFGVVPQIVIDPEGEFSTLRQKFDLVLVGKGGDTPTDLTSAKLLAHRLLELGVSAVVDLFEMSKADRPAWVAAFVQALVDAPKNLWRNLLLYVDEAHELAPEPGHGAHESRSEKDCRRALIDFAAKGRKRGYGIVAATQRLGKLSKDFAAELKNVLVGQTFIDIDRERASGCLGVAKADRLTFFKDIKVLEPGQFYALGRALCTDTTLIKIGRVITEHPEAGRRQSSPPPPTKKILHLLPQLADLPKEAEAKVLSEKELKAQIADLETRLKHALADAAHAKTNAVKVIEKAVLGGPALKAAAKLVNRLESDQSQLGRAIDRLSQAQQAILSEVGNFNTLLKQASTAHAAVPQFSERIPESSKKTLQPIRPEKAPAQNGEQPLSRCARSLLNVLVQRTAASDSQISILSGYRKTSSGFANSISQLHVRGLLEGSPDRRVITDLGRELADDSTPELYVGNDLVSYWTSLLSLAEGRMLRAIYENAPDSITRDKISEKTGYSITSSSFANVLSKLRVLELIHGPKGGDVTIADIFLEGQRSS